MGNVCYGLKLLCCSCGLRQWLTAVLETDGVRDVYWATHEASGRKLFVVLWTKRDSRAPVERWNRIGDIDYYVCNVHEPLAGEARGESAESKVAVPEPSELTPVRRKTMEAMANLGACLDVMGSAEVEALTKHHSNVQLLALGMRRRIPVIKVGIVAKGFIPHGEKPFPKTVCIKVPGSPEGLVLDVDVCSGWFSLL